METSIKYSFSLIFGLADGLMITDWLGQSPGNSLVFQALKLCKSFQLLFAWIVVFCRVAHILKVLKTFLSFQGCLKQWFVWNYSYQRTIWAHSFEQVGFFLFIIHLSVFSIIFKNRYKNFWKIVLLLPPTPFYASCQNLCWFDLCDTAHRP